MKLKQVAKITLCWLVLWISASVHAQLADFAVSFEKTDSVAQAYEGHSLQNIPLLAFNLTHSLPTEVEKFRSIYKLVCNNIQNDYRLFVIQRAKQRKWANNPQKLAEWNRSFSKRVFKKLLQEKKTICTGYAYLVRELARQVNLQCVVVDGYTTSPTTKDGKRAASHSWNAVKLNGKWYLCDPTWSSGVVDVSLGTFIARYNDTYFLLEPSLFGQNHHAGNLSWFPQ